MRWPGPATETARAPTLLRGRSVPCEGVTGLGRSVPKIFERENPDGACPSPHFQLAFDPSHEVTECDMLTAAYLVKGVPYFGLEPHA
jgi:hypothetical protein